MKNIHWFFLLIFFIVQPINAKFIDTRPPFFSVEQEKFLAEHPESFAYFTELYVYKKSPKQIEKDHQLSLEENISFLKNLIAIHVIKISNEEILNNKQLPDSVDFLVRGTQHFIEKGPLSKKFDERNVQEYFKKISQGIKEGTLSFYNSGYWITEEEHQAFLEEFDALGKKYTNISLENRKNKNPEAHRVSTCTVFIPNWEPTFFKEVKR